MAEQETRGQRESRRRREAARRRRERQLRIRMTIFAVFVILAGAIAFTALRIHLRNVKEQEAAAAASRQIAEEQAAAEASRRAADEAAAAEASRKAAEEAAAAEASRKAAEEEAAAEASRKAAEEAAAAEASRKAAEETAAAVKVDYSFKVPESIAEIPEEVGSSYALLVDVDSGTIVAGRDYDTVMNPASMTKILTLLVAVENIDLSKLDTDTEEITQEISNYVWQNQMSQVGWQIGDTPTIRSLLYGTILPSGADAAQALAIYTAGSEEEFVNLMNRKLADLGISDTAHFTNAVGAYDEDHYCTALDMATILPSGGEDSSAIGISNWFLRRIEDKDTHGEVVCAKTGYVGEAGFCCASYQESDDGGRYICVTADGAGIWPCIYDHVNIYTAFM